jgi:hypothetical protein
MSETKLDVTASEHGSLPAENELDGMRNAPRDRAIIGHFADGTGFDGISLVVAFDANPPKDNEWKVPLLDGWFGGELFSGWSYIPTPRSCAGEERGSDTVNTKGSGVTAPGTAGSPAAARKGDDPDSDLLPCPLCGGAARYIRFGGGYKVECTRCLATSGWGDYGYQVEAKWNKRTRTASETPSVDAVSADAPSRAQDNSLGWDMDATETKTPLQTLEYEASFLGLNDAFRDLVKSTSDGIRAALSAKDALIELARESAAGHHAHKNDMASKLNDARAEIARLREALTALVQHEPNRADFRSDRKGDRQFMDAMADFEKARAALRQEPGK